MRGTHVGGFIVLAMVAAITTARAEEGGRTVAADPGLAFGDWGERVVLDLPPAARGTKPDVVLVASHRAVDTEVGSGWRLQATSVIRRRSLSNGVPTTSTSFSQSLFQIDGMELVSVTGPGIPHYQPETYDGSRFEFAVNSNVWIRKRDGWTWTYGGTTGNAIRQIHTYPFSPASPCSEAGFCNTESWFLRSVVDPFDNRIDYTYTNAATPGPFATQYGNYSSSKDHLLSSITYGAGTAAINFTYEPRPDLGVEMSGGTPVFRHRRLKKVSSTVGTTGTFYSQYVFQYEDETTSETIIGTPTDCNNVAATVVVAPKHSLLRKVHRTGSTDLDPQRVIRCNKYHHEDIDWASGEQLASLVPNPFLTPLKPTDNSWKLIPAELDGDGRTDFILLAYIANEPIPVQPGGGQTQTPHQVFIATPNRPNPFVGAGGATQESLVAQSWESKLRGRLGTSIWTGRKGHAVVDIDQDSIPELIVEGGGTALIEKAQDSSVLSWVSLVNSLDDCDLRYGEFSDVDGDRRPDLIVRAHGRDGTCFAQDVTHWIQNKGAAPWFDSATFTTLLLPVQSLAQPHAWVAALEACPTGVTPPVDYYANADGNGVLDD